MTQTMPFIQNSETLQNRIKCEEAVREARFWAKKFEYSSNVVYVDPGGENDMDKRVKRVDGESAEKSTFPYKTLTKANEIVSLRSSALPAGSPLTIKINTQQLMVNNPVKLPPWTSVIGDSLRGTQLIAMNPNENLFEVDNGCYLRDMRFYGCEVDDIDNPTTGAFINFAEGAFITTSPYIQNCTASFVPADHRQTAIDYVAGNPLMPNGPCGMIVDSERLHPYSPLKSMIVDAYTQVSYNGVGIAVRNKGYAQLVSFFTHYCRNGCLTINGGHASLLNSNTTFGDYGLRSRGGREFPNVDLSGIRQTAHPEDAQDVADAKDAALSYMMNGLINANTVGDYTTDNPYHDATLKDAGLLYDAIVQELSVEKPGILASFLIGLFTTDPADGSIKPHFPAELLPDFILSYDLIEEYLKNELILANHAILKIEEILDYARLVLDKIIDQNDPAFIGRFNSLITSTSHDFSYAGSGVNNLALPLHQGGYGFTNKDIRVFRENGGDVFYTAGDETGDFFVGDDFQIRQAQGDIQGRVFKKDVLRLVTGPILSLPEQGG